MKPIFFISDAHLGFAPPEEELRRETALTDFLEWISDRAECLFVVGDLFDFWFEYASVIPRRFFRILCGLNRLRDKGVAVHYIVGNHDCWAETFFPQEMGIAVHFEPITPVLQGRQFHIEHGDGLAKKDIGYRILKKIVRNRFAVRAYKMIHPNAAFKTALFFSRWSRNHRTIPDQDEEYASVAKGLFARGTDCVVFGHTHRPYECIENGRSYINTGDWMNHFTYGKLENGRLTLEHWRPRTEHFPKEST